MKINRPWMFIGLLAIVLTLGVTAGAVLGQSANADGDSTGARQSFAGRVASILGISEGEVQNAFDQVHRENQDARVQQHLDQLVAKELLTADDAAAIKDWYSQRPDAATQLRFVLLMGPDAVQSRVDRLVERGVITQDEATAITDWYQTRPEALDNLMSNLPGPRDGYHFKFHDQFHGKFHNQFRRGGFGERGLRFHFMPHDTTPTNPPPVPSQESAGQTSL